MKRRRLTCLLGSWLLLVAVPGCGDDPRGPSLDDFLPEIPAPTGEPQGAWAGRITPESAAELIPGPASSGMIGDYFLRNARGRYVVQAATRVIGAVPPGGNLVDAVPVDASGRDLGEDHFGELSLVYVLGRTCEHHSVEVVQDGRDGGVAALRARGTAAANDIFNLRGVGLINVTPDLDPDMDDRVECATTYLLEPDAPSLRVMWTLYNGDSTIVRAPIGTFSDTGGEVHVFSPTRGFERLGLESLTGASEAAPIPYTVHQGPGVAYGLVPRHPDLEITNAAFAVAGISVMLFGAQKLLDLLLPDSFYLELPAGQGVTLTLDVVLGRDAADVEEAFQAGSGHALAELAGRVTWTDGGGAAGARVGVFADVDGDGAISADDRALTYMASHGDGAFSARLLPGTYLLRADMPDLARSQVVAVTLGAEGARDLALELPRPVAFDLSITDPTGAPIPARVTVLGRHPVPLDRRIFPTFDRPAGTLRVMHALRGTTVDMGDGADPRLELPAGGTYRVMASRGTEWSVASEVITVEDGAPEGYIELVLHHVAPAEGYVSSEYHVHQMGSPDAPVTNESRVASIVAEGVELFAATDHDYVADLQPVIEALGVSDRVRSIPGLEVTPFAYGHFNAWPITPDPSTPDRGAIDWGRGMAGYAMIPGEIFDAARDRGARIIQVNHPRSTSGNVLAFQQYFDRAGLHFDYEARQIIGDMGPVPNDWLRLPEVALWDDSFNALEVWNSISVADTNSDGVREIVSLDVVLRDWFNFLTLGFVVTPIANSDTHDLFRTPAGMPRTYVRVSDDSPQAIESGAVVAEVLDTLAGTTPRDVVLTNGPHIRVSLADRPGSVIGKVIDGRAGSVTLAISVVAPDWAAFDTLEVFANATPELAPGRTVLQPLFCHTSRPLEDLAAGDPCALAPHGAQPLDVRRIDVAADVARYEAELTLTVTPEDIIHHPLATGQDTWLVVRVHGPRAIFPVLLDNVITDESIDVLVSGDDAAREAALHGVGVPATAFTAPVYVDFDGGGYDAVLRPQ